MLEDESQIGTQKANGREQKIQCLAERLLLAGRQPVEAFTAAIEFTEICEQRLALKEIRTQGIEVLKLGNRAVCILKNNGIATIEQLATLTVADLQRMRNCGETTIDEITEAMNNAGLNLRNTKLRTWD
jgi:DNA-directed RNA polymerase alpha subunit